MQASGNMTLGARLKFFNSLGISIYTNAIVGHTGNCNIVVDSTIRFIEETDALITTDDSITLAIAFADCHPVLLQAVVPGRESKSPTTIRAIVHCSRQSLIEGILKNTLDKMKNLGATGKNTHAIIGPGLCTSCHAIKTNRHCKTDLKKVPFSLGERGYHLHVNMVKTIQDILNKHDIFSENIESTYHCTRGTKTYYSYRKGDWGDGIKRNNLAIIMPA